ncbi:MAG: peptide-N4-asparagine amidase [Sulfolobaceae archaeon]
MKWVFLISSLILISLIPYNILSSALENYSNMVLFNITQPALATDPRYYSSEPFQINFNKTPIVVKIASNLVFNNSGIVPKTVTVNIPEGNYSLMVLNVSIREYGGRQYDRPVYIFANGVPIFWGSTQEIHNSSAQSDVTIFENLLKGNVTFQIVLVNYYAPRVGITGVYSMNVTLLLYPGQKPKGLPNEYIPLFLNIYNYSRVVLNPSVSEVSEAVMIPNGTYRVVALLYYEGGALDEFWYTNQPAIRNILIYYNGLLAGVIVPYPIIYTGGINPFWWRPITSINTLSFHTPHLIDLTPMLAISQNPKITVKVSNLKEASKIAGVPYFSWIIAGVLLLWVNSSNPLLNSTILTAYSSYLDSKPIFSRWIGGIYYQQVSKYMINYTAILQFKNGTEIASVYQSGSATAYQTFNEIYQQAILVQEFEEYSFIRGIHNSSLVIQGKYPIALQFSAFAVPISNPRVIPYNLTYSQNGTLNLGLEYKYIYTFDNAYNLTIVLNENLNTIGGFSGILEVINPYGGAILVRLTQNYAKTERVLNAIYLINGKGFMEYYHAIAIQNSTRVTAGYMIEYELNYKFI